MSERLELYTRGPRIEERWIDDTAFLVDPATDALFQLNPTGSAVWRLLQEPTTLDTAAAALADAFPDILAERIRAEVRALLAELTRRGLAERRQAG